MIPPHEAVVLVVEDNADALFMLQEILRNKVGVRYVNGRASGRQLFELLKKSEQAKPDLILLDIQIPHEDGYTILKHIRERPELSNTLVVAVTANVMPQDLEKAREAGFDGFIGKPIVFRRFPEQIQRILQGECVWEAR